MEREVKDLVEVTAPREGSLKSTFTDAQIGTFHSGYVDSYDEAMQLLEKHDLTVKRSNNKGKYKWKNH
ncbi:hypothetical protein [Desulforamulus reducens]|uniref:hypothetical protein n=1 Tax=Desulforamulus reducens TaxID=59610 RepID=UPI0003092161|nr:hypothetical protein [Desulforamulus reducens]